MAKESNCRNSEVTTSAGPQLLAPRVNVTRAKHAFGRRALLVAVRELDEAEPLIVRQAIDTLSDLLHDPEQLEGAINAKVPERLADLVTCDDSFLREKAAEIFISLSNHAKGRTTIIEQPKIICNLAKGFLDVLAVVRTRIAEAIEILARDWNAAETLCTYGFLDLIGDKIISEEQNIVIVHLETLRSLLRGEAKVHAIEIGTMAKLIELLQKNDEKVIAGSLNCLAVLCEEPRAKQKSIDVNLLGTLRSLLDDARKIVHAKAASVIVLLSITTGGKMRCLELQMINRLLELSGDFHCRESQLACIKVLTNIAETPKGRSIMMDAHVEFIENLITCGDAAVERHRKILLETIYWQP